MFKDVLREAMRRANFKPPEVAKRLRVTRQTGQGRWNFKQFRPRGTLNGEQVFDLVPLNPAYKTITVGPDSPGRIIGTLVEHRRRPNLKKCP